MFRKAKEPFSEGENLCLAKVTCGSMVLVHVNSVRIVGAYISCGDSGGTVVKMLRYKSEGRWFDSR